MAIHLSLPTLVKRSTANGAVMEPPVVEPEFEARDTEFDTAELPIIEVEAADDRFASDESAFDDEPVIDSDVIETTDSVDAIAPATVDVLPSVEKADATEDATDNDVGAAVDADAELSAIDDAVAPAVAVAVAGKAVDPAQRHVALQRQAFYTLVGAVGVVLALLAVIIGFQIAERDEVRSNVHAFGVDLGGMTREDARTALVAETERQRQATFTLVDSKGEWELTTADLGLAMDVDKAVDEAFAEGRSGWGASRLALLWHFRPAPTVVGTDTVGVQGDLLDGKLANLAQAIYQVKVDPVLTVSPDTGVSYTRHVVGRDLDVAATRNAILMALTYGDTEVELVVNETQPVAFDTDYATVRKQLDNLYNGDIKLNTPADYWTMTPLDVSRWLTVIPASNGQSAALSIDQTWVEDVVSQISLATDSYPQSPRIWWGEGGGFVKIAEGKQGLDLNEDEAIGLIRSVFLGEQEMNDVTLPVAVTKTPDLPADLNSLGIAYPLASSTTAYGGGLPARSHNIELAARLLNGTVVMPGQTFSFNAEIGDMTVDAGFQVAYGIATENGQTTTVPAEAGGICQVSTTVFQPVFWTGYEIDQRGWHALWIPRYAYNGIVGLDATVEPTVGQDFKWTNNTGTAVMLEVYADGENLTAQLYGTTPNWRVEVDQAAISNERPADPEIVYQPTDTIPVGTTRSIEHAQDGFDVNITRRVFEGDQVREEQFWSTYAPARNVVLVGSDNGELPAGYSSGD